MQPLSLTDPPPITPERLAALLLWLAEQGEAGLGAREVAEVLWLTRLLPALAGVDKPEEPIGPDPAPQPRPSQPGPEPGRQQDVGSREDTSKEHPRGEANAAAAALLPAEALPTMDDLPQAVPVWLEDPPLLSQPLLYQKALVPLLAQRAESGRVRVDEEETVERYGRDLAARFRGSWPPITPVWRPVPEPQFDLVLAMDGGLSMPLWERLLPELRRVFAAAGAFRDLKILPLFDGQGRLRPMAQLIPPPQEGRQLLLLLSDCAGEHWWSGALRPVLEHWAIHLPFAVLQVLPRRMWERTALGQEGFSMSNSVPAAPARRYRIGPQRRIPRRRRGPEAGAGALLLPVLSCDPDSLRSWSGLVMGDPRFRIAGYRLPLPQPSRNSQEAPAAEVDPLQLWLRYCELASPQGRELARLLAAAPVLTLPVMRLVKQALMAGDPTPLAMAEVLLGGLLRLIPGQPDPRQPDRCDALQFDFRPGLREHLLAQSDRADTLAVMKAVSLLVQERWNRFAPDQSFQAYLVDPRAQAPANLQGLQAFGRVMASIVERLGGRYQAFAQQLRQGAQKEAAAPGKDGPSSAHSGGDFDRNLDNRPGLDRLPGSKFRDLGTQLQGRYQPPRKLLEVLQTIQYEEGLPDGDPRYVDSREARGSEKIFTRLARKFGWDPASNAFFAPYEKHIMFFGHIGIGKTTELRRYAGQLNASRRFYVVEVDVLAKLDRNNLQYTEVLMAMAEALLERLYGDGFVLGAEALEPLQGWFGNVVETKTTSSELSAQLKTVAEGGGGIPGLIKLLATFTAAFKTGSSQKSEWQRKIRNDFIALAQAFNTLIRRAEAHLAREARAERLLFLIDGTDKMRGEDTQQFFVQDAEQLLAIETLVIYTAPLHLKYDGRLGGKLDADIVLPMMKLLERDGTPFEAGWTTMRRLLLLRADRCLFASDADVERLVEFSGGHPRELLRLLKLCCELADDQIDAAVVQTAIEKLAADYRYFLKPTDYALIKAIDINPAYRNNEEQAQGLLDRLAMLQYNDGARRSHPVVRTLEGYALATPSA